MDCLQLDIEERERRLRGKPVIDTLYIDEKTMVSFPFHRILDYAAEYHRVHRLGTEPIDTTARGIGPGFSEESNRCAAYFYLFNDKDRLRKHIERLAETSSGIIKHVYEIPKEVFLEFFRRVGEADRRGARELISLEAITEEELNFSRFLGNEDERSFNIDRIVEEYWGIGQRFLERVVDLPLLLHKWVSQGRAILYEGAQGRLLDIREGYSPNTSVSSTIASEVIRGTGYNPGELSVIGVMKGYETKVGNHIFPAKIGNGELRNRLEKLEFGATTGRQRMVGWLDLPQLRRSQLVDRCDQIVITKLDPLSGAEELKVAELYVDPKTGKEYVFAPSDPEILRRLEVRYRSMPAWTEDITSCQTFDELPNAAQYYISFIMGAIKEVFPEQPLSLNSISVGNRRDQLIRCNIPEVY